MAMKAFCPSARPQALGPAGWPSRGPAASAAAPCRPRGRRALRVAAAGVWGGPAARFAAPPPPSSPLHAELRAQLDARWLPYDAATADAALRLAAALASERARAGLAAGQRGSTEMVARSALTYYRQMVRGRILDGSWVDTPFDLRPRPRQQPQPQPPRPRVWPSPGAFAGAPAPSPALDRISVAAALHALRRERAQVERWLAAGGLSSFRADDLAMQAESLSRDVAALEKLLRAGGAPPLRGR